MLRLFQVMSGFIVGGVVHVFFAQIGPALGLELPIRNGPFYLYYVSEKGNFKIQICFMGILPTSKGLGK